MLCFFKKIFESFSMWGYKFVSCLFGVTESELFTWAKSGRVSSCRKYGKGDSKIGRFLTENVGGHLGHLTSGWYFDILESYKPLSLDFRNFILKEVEFKKYKNSFFGRRWSTTSFSIFMPDVNPGKSLDSEAKILYQFLVPRILQFSHRILESSLPLALLPFFLAITVNYIPIFQFAKSKLYSFTLSNNLASHFSVLKSPILSNFTLSNFPVYRFPIF